METKALNAVRFSKDLAHLTNNVLDTVKHHLYVCPTNSKALEDHLLFRNHLRTNDQARLDYQSMKCELAEKANQDQKRYAELKELTLTSYIDSIVEKRKNNCD